MLLKRLALKNFKKHENLELTFKEGLTAIRGGNEAGKSSIIDAIQYAFFGPKSVKSAASDLVTWGALPKSMSVEVEVGSFVISRC